MPRDAVGFDKVLQEELAYIRSRRQALKLTENQRTKDAAAPATAASSQLHSVPSPAQHQIQTEALGQDLCGLTISGGGIRSATFGLGILQGLASEGLLERIDYLSTVSGGGYIGGWFTAWNRRQSVRKVATGLRPSWFDGESHAAYVEKGEIRHLRLYSNFLSPRVSITSMDGWILIAIYVRNLLLNQLVLLLGAIAAFLALRTLVEVFCCFRNLPEGICLNLIALASFALFLAALRFTYRFAIDTQKQGSVDVKLTGLKWLIGLTVATALAASLLFLHSAANDWFSGGMMLRTVVQFAVAMGAMHAIVGHALGTPRPNDCQKKDYRSTGSFLGAVAGALCGVALAGVLSQVTGYGHRVAMLAVHGVPLLLTTFVLANFLQIGLMGHRIDAHERERWSSLNARLLRIAALWLAVLGACVYGPQLIIWLTNPDVVGPAYAHVTGWILGGSWVSATWAALAASNSPRSSGGKNHLFELIARAGPAIFILGLLTALGYFFTWAVYDVYALAQDWPLQEQGFRAIQSSYLDNLEEVQPAYWLPLTEKVQVPFYPLAMLMVATAFFVWVGVMAAKQIGVNIFSLHELYALRLIRCYLGAIRHKERRPSLITNYDAEDDLKLSELQQQDKEAGRQTDGPLHILCAAVNRRSYGATESSLQNASQNAEPTEQQRACRVAEELAFQDRKADSFVFTANYCGSEATGYCATNKFAGDVSLGTAMAVSGAAVSPNSGYHSSPDVGALLTIFNLRLGAWFGNPNSPATRGAANPPGWKFLYRELLGAVNAEDEYIYVSDGGHFENMGVYELVRRRCRFIIAVDTWADPEMTRENLGRLVRSVRIDFGVRIEIDVEGTRAKDGRCQSHIAVGKIHYGDVHSLVGSPRPVFNDPQYHYEANEGVLVYIKMGLTGDEPNDLLNYQSENPDFPHHPISDQFFDEAQFESYRALGLHSARVLMQGDAPRPGEASSVGPRESNRSIFERIYERWLAPPPHLMDSYTRYNEVYAELLGKLRGDHDLRLLAQELYGDDAEKLAAKQTARNAAQNLAERLIVGEMCALVENVWFGVDLERHILHPVHEGWLNVFRNWTAAYSFWRHWTTLQGEYSPGTRKFMDRMRNAPYENQLHALIRTLAANGKMGPLCRELRWETAAPGDRDLIAEKQAVELLDCTFREIWTQLNLSQNPADSLGEHWRAVWRSWQTSKIFCDHWKTLERAPPC